MRDPFHIEGPAVISFSGGRTSGYMLWRILQAHGGGLPDDVRVLFANTGKEMPETLDFVQECSDRWDVEITWVEFRPAEKPKDRWTVVTHETSSRDGEPFSSLIHQDGKPYLPNPVKRICTYFLKVRTMSNFCQQSLGWKEWVNVVGLRADESRRVSKMKASNNNSNLPYQVEMPLAEGNVSVGDVTQFWSAQPFDLRLPNMNGKTMHGNCDLCFLKGAKQIYALIREKPERAVWWIGQEARVQSSGLAIGQGGRFRSDRPSYQQMYDAALSQEEMFKFDNETLEDCSCTD